MMPAQKTAPCTLNREDNLPALPRIAFLFDGNPLVTNKAGEASVTQQRDSRPHSLGVVPFTLPSGNRRYRFSRWKGESDAAQAGRITLSGPLMRRNSTLIAGFTVLCPVTLRFAIQDGEPVSQTGTQVGFSPRGITWLAPTTCPRAPMA